MNEPQRYEDESEGASHERWVISYADFVTLMFAFFVVLYATSQKDAEKSKKFEESAKRYLIKAAAPQGAGGGPAQIEQNVDANNPIEQPIQTYVKSKPETVKILDEAEEFIDTRLDEKERKKYVMDLLADEWGVRIVIPSSALFSAGSEKFRSDALPFIDKLSGLLAATKRKVLINGHVSAGEKGTYKSTWEFASARATNFLRYVQKKENMADDRLVMASLADTKPLFQKDRAADNSRLEIVLMNSDMDF